MVFTTYNCVAHYVSLLVFYNDALCIMLSKYNNIYNELHAILIYKYLMQYLYSVILNYWYLHLTNFLKLLLKYDHMNYLITLTIIHITKKSFLL